MTEGYLFDNAGREAGDRFSALAELFDAVTFRHLGEFGVAAGWRCLEIGAGGGSVASWLAARVGPSGHVLATDLDVRWLKERLAAPNVEVRHHDITEDALPEQTFDLVHERLVLVHVPERTAALGQLVSSLRPGGWLLAEDFDSAISPDFFVLPASSDEALGNRILQSVRTLLANRGADTALGHKLPRLLREAGLEDVGADAYQVLDGTDAITDLVRANVAQVADQLVDEGLIGAPDLGHFLEALDSGAVRPISPLLVSAWGRRPLA